MKIKRNRRKNIFRKKKVKISGNTNSNIFAAIIITIMIFFILLELMITKIIEKKNKIERSITIKLDIKKQIIKKTYPYE